VSPQSLAHYDDVVSEVQSELHSRLKGLTQGIENSLDDIVNLNRFVSPQSFAQYDDVVSEVQSELHSRLRAASRAGVPKWDLIGDPGVGFAKSSEQTLDLLAAIHRFGLR